ncbi:rho-related GTP-binding protein RhoU [Prionailurus iriomotensis]
MRARRRRRRGQDEPGGELHHQRLPHRVHPHRLRQLLGSDDVVSPSSFQNVSEKWVPEIRCHCPKAPIVLVGTQSDLREDVKVLIELDKCKEKPVPEEAAKLCAEEIKAASYIECSALTQKNLKEVFDAAIVAGIQYSDTQQQPKKRKSRTPDKMKNLSKSWWKKYCCVV